MNSLALVLRLYVPEAVKKRHLAALFDATASAIGVATPSLRGLSFEEILSAYARFTKLELGKRIQLGQDLEGIRTKLYAHAYQLGDDLRRRLRLKTIHDVLTMGRVLYRTIGIDFEGNPNGEITIRSCYFSEFYTPEVCRVISALDEGIASGLSGGGDFSFSHRITEGNSCCTATLTLKGLQE